jgi:hypothetical protein
MAAVPAPASEAAALNVEGVQAEQNESPAKVAEESAEEAAEEAAEEPVAATFADAVQHDAIEAVSAQPDAVPVIDAALLAEEAGPPVVETLEVPTSEAAAEGEEDMARERAKTGKSNWHQIRTGSAAAETNNIVEAAKQAEPAIEEAPKAMAAAAAAESAPPAAASPDANTIASIVDSVLADLRPKIVEEIAKKLAGK